MMQPFTVLTAVAAPLEVPKIDNGELFAITRARILGGGGSCSGSSEMAKMTAILPCSAAAKRVSCRPMREKTGRRDIIIPEIFALPDFGAGD